jgi:hypothetical protein
MLWGGPAFNRMSFHNVNDMEVNMLDKVLNNLQSGLHLCSEGRSGYRAEKQENIPATVFTLLEQFAQACSLISLSIIQWEV